MGLMSDAGGFLDGLFGIDTSDALDKNKAINDYLNSGAIKDASTPLGTDEGKALVAALSKARPVRYSEPGAGANDAALAAARAHYADQFANGGLREGAALQQAQLAGDLTSRGGLDGIHQNILESVDRQQRVGAVANDERAQGGNAVNALQASDATAALKRAVLAAQVSHANFSNAYNQNAALFGLRNSQAQLQNTAQGQVQNTQYEQAGLGIEQQQQQAALGQAMLGMLANAGGGLASTALAQRAADVPSSITAGSLPTTASAPTTMLGNYAIPGIQAGADAQARTYQPIFNTPSSAPIDPGYWSTR